MSETYKPMLHPEQFAKVVGLFCSIRKTKKFDLTKPFINGEYLVATNQKSLVALRLDLLDIEGMQKDFFSKKRPNNALVNLPIGYTDMDIDCNRLRKYVDSSLASGYDYIYRPIPCDYSKTKETIRECNTSRYYGCECINKMRFSQLDNSTIKIDGQFFFAYQLRAMLTVCDTLEVPLVGLKLSKGLEPHRFNIGESIVLIGVVPVPKNFDRL